jgi:hypothetical protein
VPRVHALAGAIALALLLAGCGLPILAEPPGPAVAGAGHMQSERRAVRGVRAVEFSAFGALTITQGDEESLTITGQPNVLPLITSAMDGDILQIRMGGNVASALGLKIDLRVRELREISLNDAGDIAALGLSGDALRVTISGSGSLRAAGRVDAQTVELSGAGAYDGGGLESRLATVTISGFADALLRAREQLRANISGSGTVEYYGQPQVIEEISGLGQVMRRTR